MSADKKTAASGGSGLTPTVIEIIAQEEKQDRGNAHLASMRAMLGK